VIGRFDQAVARHADKGKVPALRRATAQNRKALQLQIRKLYKLATLVARRNGARG
jgi:hypothetical protein